MRYNVTRTVRETHRYLGSRTKPSTAFLLIAF